MKTFVIGGTVVDAVDGEALVGATVQRVGQGGGAITDRYGRFSLALDVGPAQLRISYLGYAPALLGLEVRSDTLVDVRLEPTTEALGGIDVTAESDRSLVPELGRVRLSPAEIEAVPPMAGEPDLVKALQLMPGVSGGQEGSAGLFVRGGSPDQNLVLLDGTPVYNATHMLGFLSTFNPDIVRSAELTKGAGSARYGGRLSSVLDVSLKEGDRYERRTRGAVGLVSARATTEGPIRQGQSSYVLSLRRTYLDAIWRLFQPPYEKYGYHFYDGVGKASVVGPKHGLYVSFYGGRDTFWQTHTETLRGGDEEDYDGSLSWGNVAGAVRWDGQLSPRLNVGAGVSVTHYGLGFREETEERFRDGTSSTRTDTYGTGITDWTARIGTDLRVSSAHALSAGVTGTLHAFRPSAARTEVRGQGAGSSRESGASENVIGRSAAAFVEDAFSYGALSGAAGLRVVTFASTGAPYLSVEPRMVLGYAVGRGIRVEGSLARSAQFVHLLSRSGVGIPLDLWLPATGRVGPQRAWQAALGVTADGQAWGAGPVSLSAEVFVKQMRGVVAPLEGASLLGVDAVGWEDRVEVGRGTARGLELLVRKREGRLRGWAAYTLGWATRQFDGIDGGEAFPYRYDRRHDVSLTAAYNLPRRWTLSGTWVYATGEALWLPGSRVPSLEGSAGFEPPPFYDPDLNGYVYGPRNRTRAPAYHRLDVAFRHTRSIEGGERTWTLGLYNAYGRRNPFFLYPKGRPEGRIEYRQLSPFVFVPAISYERSF